MESENIPPGTICGCTGTPIIYHRSALKSNLSAFIQNSAGRNGRIGIHDERAVDLGTCKSKDHGSPAKKEYEVKGDGTVILYGSRDTR